MSGPWRRSLDHIRERLGRLPSAVLAYLTGAGIVIGVCWPVGLAAHASQPVVDVPAFGWFQHRQAGAWSDVWWKLTDIGSPTVTQTVTVVAALVFAAIWLVRRRSWWVPLSTFPAAYLLEKYTQIAVQDLVHRGHPPTTHGTFPSGGCGRVLVVYGLVWLFTCDTFWPRSRRAFAVGRWLVAVALSIQAYARVYNLEHWLTDVLGGIVFGSILLTVAATCRALLAGSAATDAGAEPAGGAPEDVGEMAVVPDEVALEPLARTRRHRGARPGVVLREPPG